MRASCAQLNVCTSVSVVQGSMSSAGDVSVIAWSSLSDSVCSPCWSAVRNLPQPAQSRITPCLLSFNIINVSPCCAQKHTTDDVQVVLVALPGFNVQALSREVSEQTAHLPRGATATQALEHSCAVSVDSRATALRLSNAYAPEHLIINTADAESWLPDIENAGSVFLGRWTPESVGDYASGTNHVLPTYGYARMYSGVNLDAFCKKMTVQSLTQAGLQKLAPAVSKMAEVEGLEAHRRAVTLRLQQQ